MRRHEPQQQPVKRGKSFTGHLIALLVNTIVFAVLAVVAEITLSRTTNFQFSTITWWWIPAGAFLLALLWEIGAFTRSDDDDDRRGDEPGPMSDIYGRTTQTFYDQTGNRRDVTYRPGSAYGYGTIESEKENGRGWY